MVKKVLGYQKIVDDKLKHALAVVRCYELVTKITRLSVLK